MSSTTLDGIVLNLDNSRLWFLAEVVSIAFLVGSAVQIIYRLYFHPLANFPGPKLAAITWWYEIYYEIILRGQYTFKLGELHKEYGISCLVVAGSGVFKCSWQLQGPILRLNPDSLHINDPDYYDVVFSNSAGKVDKSYGEAIAFGSFAAVRPFP